MRGARPFAAATLLVMLAGHLPSADAQVSVFRLQVLNESGMREGTCFVIHQETLPEGTYLVLATSARLFERQSGRRALVHLTGRPPVEIAGDAIMTPYDNQRDVAILKTVVAPVAAAPLRVTFDRVGAGSRFVISGIRADGSVGSVDQHVRFCATRAVLGDRLTRGLVGCQGAPAMVGQRVFGIVSECSADRVPEITPLAVSMSFLRRAVPGLRDEPLGGPPDGEGNDSDSLWR
jgi:hypothetical protein